jgi:ribosomal protein L37AE/L43A
MEGIIWLFLALTVALVAVGILRAGRHRPSGIISPRHCSICQTPMSLRRVSIFHSLTFRGIWMCPHCGTRIKWRKGVTGTVT